MWGTVLRWAYVGVIVKLGLCGGTVLIWAYVGRNLVRWAYVGGQC